MTTATRDYELEARLLVRWCSWRWMRNRKKGLCLLWPPFDGSEWEPSPGYVKQEDEDASMEQVVGVPTIEERFSDWHRACAKRVSEREVVFGMPALSMSLDACAMLIQAVGLRGYDFEIHRQCYVGRGDGWTVDVRILRGDTHEQVAECDMPMGEFSAASEAMAIAMAADKVS
jgi:hypothetical protein